MDVVNAEVKKARAAYRALEKDRERREHALAWGVCPDCAGKARKTSNEFFEMFTYRLKYVCEDCGLKHSVDIGRFD